MARSINPVPQYFDESRKPLALGKMYYFISGTTTPKTTYKDVNQTDENDHPVVLDGEGRLPNVFFDGAVRQVLTDANDVQIWEREPVNADSSAGACSPYDANTTYSKNDLVIAEDGNYYRSLQDNNQNNTPETSPTFWVEVEFLEYWNANISYSQGDNVKTDEGMIWRSLSNDNLGNDPATSAEWANNGVEAFAYISNYTVVNGFGIASVAAETAGPFDGARVTFTKAANSTTNQTLHSVGLSGAQDYYTEPANWTADSVLVIAENYAGLQENANGDFVIVRYLA